ncbi:hypothetical protein, partial [Luteipulveratus flavus]
EHDELHDRAPPLAPTPSSQQQSRLLDLRDEKRRQAPTVTYVQQEGDSTFREAWDRAVDDAGRRVVLDGLIRRVRVRKGRPGRRTREQLLERIEVEWQPRTGEWFDHGAG